MPLVAAVTYQMSNRFSSVRYSVVSVVQKSVAIFWPCKVAPLEASLVHFINLHKVLSKKMHPVLFGLNNMKY